MAESFRYWVPPFTTGTILLRAVRDRPVVFAAKRGCVSLYG
nr:MAG TPA: hypothetical protein [Caudoviricetes sp.]